MAHLYAVCVTTLMAGLTMYAEGTRFRPETLPKVLIRVSHLTSRVKSMQRKLGNLFLIMSLFLTQRVLSLVLLRFEKAIFIMFTVSRLRLVYSFHCRCHSCILSHVVGASNFIANILLEKNQSIL